MTLMGKLQLYFKVGWRIWAIGFLFLAISVTVMQAIGVTSLHTENLVSLGAVFVGLGVGCWWAWWSFKQPAPEGTE